MRDRTNRRRVVVGLAAAAMTLALGVPVAGAQASGPANFSGTAEALALDLQIVAPEELLGQLDAAEGINQRISQTLSELTSTGKAEAVTSLLVGTLLNEQLTSGDETSGRSEFVDQDIAGIVQLRGGVMEYTADPASNLSRSFSELAYVKVSLEGLSGDAAAAAAVQGAVQDAVGIVNETIGGLNEVLGEVESQVNEVLEDAPISLPDLTDALVLQVPDIMSVPLLEARKIWSESIVTTEDDHVVSTSDSGIAEVSILGGLVRIPAFQYQSVARTTGEPGGATADTSTTVVSVQLADDTLIEVGDTALSVGDVVLDLTDPALADLDLSGSLAEITDLVGDLLNTVGVSVAQGEGTTDVASDGSRAQAATSAFAINVRPLNALSATGDEDAAAAAEMFSVGLNLLPTNVVAMAAPAEAQAPPPALPRTGGGAAAILGLIAIAAAVRLRFN